MANPTYRPVGPLLAGTRSTAVLGIEEALNGPGRAVVLVWAPAELRKDEERANQLQRETRRASELEHPHIVTVYGLATLSEGLARVVEFVDGESLRQVLDLVAPLPPRIAARVVADVALGAHYAHLAGNDDGTPMVHGDLRPETVMVTYAGKAKASGYGALAVAPREASGLRVVNRRRYAAPEQIIGGRTASTPQTDVFLLGLLLYEMVSGQKPWDGEPDLDHAAVSRPLPLEPEDHIPAELVPVLERATRKRASDRYPTALAFRDAVDQALSLAPHSDVAAFMERHFPKENSPRAARSQVLAEARAAQSRRQEEARARAAKLPPPPRPVAGNRRRARPRLRLAGPPSPTLRGGGGRGVGGNHLHRQPERQNQADDCRTARCPDRGRHQHRAARRRSAPAARGLPGPGPYRDTNRRFARVRGQGAHAGRPLLGWAAVPCPRPRPQPHHAA